MLFVEKDASLLKAYLSENISGALEGATIILDETGIDIVSAVRNLADPFTHTRVRVLALPWVDDQTWLKAIYEGALNIQRELSLNALSYAYQLPIWIKAVRANLSAWAASRSGDALRGACAGETAIIVAAGPSLDHNVADLAPLRDRAIIIAVDTALRRLDAAGIVPDIAVAVDANEANARDVDGLDAEMLDTMLIADQIVTPKIVTAFTGPRVFLRSINWTLGLEGEPKPIIMPLDDLLFDISGQRDLPSWQSGGSVATNAFFLAHYLGCKRMIFVGQDLAYTRNRAHSSGVGHEEGGMAGRFAPREMMMRERVADGELTVEGWNGERLRTSPVLREYLRWYENTIARGFGRESEIFDATEGGAKKAGMKPIRLRDADKMLGVKKDFRAILNERLAKAPIAVAGGWEDRMKNLDLSKLARWIALPAYLGSGELRKDVRDDLIAAALRDSESFLKNVFQ